MGYSHPLSSPFWWPSGGASKGIERDPYPNPSKGTLACYLTQLLCLLDLLYSLQSHLCPHFLPFPPHCARQILQYSPGTRRVLSLTGLDTLLGLTPPSLLRMVWGVYSARHRPRPVAVPQVRLRCHCPVQWPLAGRPGLGSALSCCAREHFL